METKKKYYDYAVKKFERPAIVGCFEGYISKRGIINNNFTKQDGTIVESVKCYVNVPNRGKTLAKILDIQESTLMISDPTDAGDEFVTVPVVMFGYTAKNAEQYLKAGYKVAFPCEFTKTQKDDKIFVQAVPFAFFIHSTKTKNEVKGDNPELPEKDNQVIAPTQNIAEPIAEPVVESVVSDIIDDDMGDDLPF